MRFLIRKTIKCILLNQKPQTLVAWTLFCFTPMADCRSCRPSGQQSSPAAEVRISHVDGPSRKLPQDRFFTIQLPLGFPSQRRGRDPVWAYSTRAPSEPKPVVGTPVWLGLDQTRLGDIHRSTTDDSPQLPA